MSCKYISYLNIVLIKSSDGPSVQRSGTICNSGRGHHEEQFCDIILNFDHLINDIS